MGHMKKAVLIFLVMALALSMSATAFAASLPMATTNNTIATSGLGGTRNYALILKEDGSLWGRGYNNYGNLGFFNDPDLKPRYSINEWVKIMENVVSVSTNYGLTLAVKKDGSLWAWGRNGSGEVGNGGKSNIQSNGEGVSIQTTPVKILDNVASAYAGSEASYAVKKDGSLWTWGNNVQGLFGDGTTKNSNVPKKIMDGVVMVSPGQEHTLALKTDGSVWAWGSNAYGQIGNSGKTDFEISTILNGAGKKLTLYYQITPVKVLDGAVEISAGNYHSFALKSDGSVWGWGYNLSSELGNGGKSNSYYDSEAGKVYAVQDVPINLMDNVKSIHSSTSDGSYVIKSDNSLWGWGVSEHALGIGSSTQYQKYPVKIMDDVVYVNNCSAIKSDNSLWVWGEDYGRWQSIGGIGNFVDPSEIGNLTSPTKLFEGMLMPSKAALMADVSANPTSSKIIVNGKEVSFEAYSINGNNYFKLRDVAKALSGTGKQFEVKWDGTKNVINLVSGSPYTAVGGELAVGDGKAKTAVFNSSPIYKDGVQVNLAAYTINGNNYFKLRDVGQAFDFGVTWDGAANTIRIDTSIGYQPESN